MQTLRDLIADIILQDLVYYCNEHEELVSRINEQGFIDMVSLSSSNCFTATKPVNIIILILQSKNYISLYFSFFNCANCADYHVCILKTKK